MARLLVLRAPPDAEISAARIESLGHRAIIAPLRHAESVFDPAPRTPEALVATSANALRLGTPIPDDWHHLPFFCVGERSAVLAAAGFSDIRVAENVEGLISVLRNSAQAHARLLYLAGEPRRPQLESAFPSHLDIWLRYRMVEVAELPENVTASLRAGECDAVLHFSELSAQVWFRLAEQAGVIPHACALVQACISEAVAAQVRASVHAAGQGCRIVVAKDMHGDGVIAAALDALRDQPGPQFAGLQFD